MPKIAKEGRKSMEIAKNGQRMPENKHSNIYDADGADQVHLAVSFLASCLTIAKILKKIVSYKYYK